MTNNHVGSIENNTTDFAVSTHTPSPATINNFREAIKNLKIPDLVKQGILPKENTESYLFYLISENPSHALFRKNQHAEELLTDLWVSKVYQKATKIFLENLSTTYADGSIDDDYLNNTAKLSSNIESIKNLDEYFIKKGIIFLIEPYIPGSKVDGVSLKLPNGIPVIGLSLRHKRLDSFWFTLLHELAHIKLHYEQLDTPIIDDLDNNVESKIEKQANLTAKHSILSKQIFRTIDFQELRSKANLFQLAKDTNVHPALIAGIIRFHLNNYTLHSDIIHKHDVKSILEGSL